RRSFSTLLALPSAIAETQSGLCHSHNQNERFDLILSSGSGKKIEMAASISANGLKLMAKNKTKGRGAGRLPAEEAAKLGDRLLDAAQELFIEKGFTNTTMDEIARRAGSSTQTIYSRFSGKSEVLQAVVMRLGDRMPAVAHIHARDTEPKE